MTENFKHYFEIISKFYENIIEFQQNLIKDYGISSLNKMENFLGKEKQEMLNEKYQ